MDKLDETFGQVAKALADATNKYGPDVAEYVLKTVYYDAMQFYIRHALLAIGAIVAIYIFKTIWVSANSVKNRYSDPELVKGFAAVLFVTSWFLLVGTVVSALNVYPYQALFGDPKIALTKKIIEKL